MQAGTNRLSLPSIKTHRDPQSKEGKQGSQEGSVARLQASSQNYPEKSAQNKFWKPYTNLLTAREVVPQPPPTLKPVITRRKKEEEVVDRQNVLQLDEWRPVNNSLQQRKRQLL